MKATIHTAYEHECPHTSLYVSMNTYNSHYARTYRGLFVRYMAALLCRLDYTFHILATNHISTKYIIGTQTQIRTFLAFPTKQGVSQSALTILSLFLFIIRGVFFRIFAFYKVLLTMIFCSVCSITVC